MNRPLKVSGIRKAVEKLKAHGITGDFYMRVHPSMRDAAKKAQALGLVKLVNPPVGAEVIQLF